MNNSYNSNSRRLPSWPHVKNQFKEEKRREMKEKKMLSYPLVMRKCNSYGDDDQLYGNWFNKKCGTDLTISPLSDKLYE